jgi:hypothetical protein
MNVHLSIVIYTLTWLPTRVLGCAATTTAQGQRQPAVLRSAEMDATVLRFKKVFKKNKTFLA